MKKGFTLAEVLITLGIIGVVAALSMPTLQGTYQKSKIGPTLLKFKTTIENANELMLNDHDADKLTDMIEDWGASSNTYLTAITRYVKGSVDESDLREKKLYKYDGSTYSEDPLPIFNLESGGAFATAMLGSSNDVSIPPKATSSHKGGKVMVFFDINGFDTKPNKYGKDIFTFIMDNDGSLLPYGSKACYSSYNYETAFPSEKSWKGKCDENGVTDANYCTGNIADNNWKVIYY